MKFSTIFCSLLSLVGVGFGFAYLPTHSQSPGDLIREAYTVQDAETSTAKPEKVEDEFGTQAPNGGTYLSPGVGDPAGEITSEIKPVNLPGETMVEVGVGNQPAVPEPAPQVEEAPDELVNEQEALMKMRIERTWLGIAEDLDAVARKAQSLKIPYIGKYTQAHFNGMGSEFERGLAGLEEASKLHGAARLARKLHGLDQNSAEFQRIFRMFLSSAFGPDWNQASIEATSDAMIRYNLYGPGHGIFNDFLDQQIATLDLCID